MVNSIYDLIIVNLGQGNYVSTNSMYYIAQHHRNPGIEGRERD